MAVCGRPNCLSRNRQRTGYWSASRLPASRRSDHTILSGGHPRAKAPLVPGNEGAGVIEDVGDSGLAVGSRVMFTGPYGVRENGAWQEWLLARPEDLAFVPDAIDYIVAASLQWPI